MTASDTFWERDPSSEEQSDEDLGAPRGPLEAFLTGGLPGLIEEAGDVEDSMMSDDEIVEDPDLLRAAEEAVARVDDGPGGAAPPASDEEWVPVATQSSPAGEVGLRDVLDLLESEAVPAGWDPFDPVDQVGGVPGVTRPYRLLVPASSLARARDLLHGVAPEGVEYAWEGGREAGGVPPIGDGARVNLPVPVTGVDGPLSDNQLLSGLASPGRGRLVLVSAIAIGILAVGLALLALARG